MEFDLIHQYFTPLGLAEDAEQAAISGKDIGIGDDGAVLSIPDDKQLVVVTDTLVSGVHFPEDSSAYDVAWRSLAVNLSDLAAMGATPFAYSLGLSLPIECATDEKWMADFAKGFADLVKDTGLPIVLVGGDTTRSKVLTLTVSAKGLIDNGQAVLRSGAQKGDLIAVTGVLGEGALGLKVALNQLEMALSEQQQQAALDYFNRPKPQLALGMQLQECASSAIDISDGLLQDLGHILKSSGRKQQLLHNTVDLGAKIYLDKLPLSQGMQQLFTDHLNWQMPLSGGDDYQLCITVSPEKLKSLEALAVKTATAVTIIGEVTASGEIATYYNGVRQRLDVTGFQHF